MANGSIRVNVPKLDLQTELQKQLADLVGQATANKVATELILEMCEEGGYVPIGNADRIDSGYGFKDTLPGLLRTTGRATEKLVIWDTPYAHYVWEGIIYGPNIPIHMQGSPRVVVGWASKPGVKKHPTGRQMEYSTLRAERHWVQAMLRNERRVFNNAVTRKLKAIAKKRGKTW